MSYWRKSAIIPNGIAGIINVIIAIIKYQAGQNIIIPVITAMISFSMIILLPKLFDRLEREEKEWNQ